MSLRESLRSSPRFGFTNNFSDLFDEEKQDDYITGICITAIIIGCIFLCWGLLILILKCMGKRRVGFLSGAPYDATDLQGKPSKRPARGRIVFGIAGVLFIVFTMLLLFLGFANLEATTHELATGAALGSNVFEDTRTVLRKFLDLAIVAGEKRDNFVSVVQEAFETGEITVSNRTNVTLPNVTLSPAAVGTAKFIYNGINLQEQAAAVVDALYALDAFIKEPMQELNRTITDGQRKCDQLYRGLSGVQLMRLRLGFGIPLNVLAFVMLLLMGLTAKGVNSNTKQCFTSWCLMPLFISIVMFLVILTMAFAIGGIVNADFCSGGTDLTPDETIMEILDKKKIDQTSLNYRTISYLVNDCDFSEAPVQEFPLEFMVTFETQLDAATERLLQFTTNLNSVGLSLLSQDLEVNVTEVDARLTVFREQAIELIEKSIEILKLLACERLYEVYSKVIHDATCEKSYTGVLWVFVSFLVISFSGCLMIMFRATLYPLAGAETDDYSWNEVKEQDGPADLGSPDIDDGGAKNSYVQDAGLQEKPKLEDAPMGGQAQQRYETVGDDNPFLENNETFAPQKSSWE